MDAGERAVLRTQRHLWCTIGTKPHRSQRHLWCTKGAKTLLQVDA